MAQDILDADAKTRGRKPAKTKPDVRRVTFNLSESHFRALEELADRRGASMTEVLRRAIASEVYLQGEAELGRRVIIEDGDGTNRKELLMGI